MSSSEGRLVRLANLTNDAGENLNRAEEALRQLKDADPAVECLAVLVKDMAVTMLGIVGEMHEVEEERKGLVPHSTFPTARTRR